MIEDTTPDPILPGAQDAERIAAIDDRVRESAPETLREQGSQDTHTSPPSSKDQVRVETLKLLNAAFPKRPSEDTTEAPLPLNQIGRFRIERRIGAGSFGHVFLATDPVLQRNVAVKIPLSGVFVEGQVKSRFLSEGATAAKLQHPNVVPVFEAGEEDGMLYVVSEYCDGPDLAKWLVEQGCKIEPDLAVRIVAQLADALAHLHSKGILHRDIKPANVLLQRSQGSADGFPYIPRLTDFGLAKNIQTESGGTRTGMILGTLKYVSPEQARSETQHLTSATDIYSLGVVLYELLTGRVPLDAATDYEQLKSVCEEEVVPPSKLGVALSKDLDSVCLKCLEKDVQDRYQSAAELRDDLRRILDGQPVDVKVAWAGARTWRRVRRSPRALAAIGGIVIAGCLAGSFFLPEGEQRAGSLRLNGTTEHMVATSLVYDGTYPITVEAWVFSDGNPGVILELSGLISLNLHSDKKGILVSVGAQAPNDSFHLLSDEPIPKNTWAHVAGIYNGSTLNIFVNGQFQPGELHYRTWEESGEKTGSEVLFTDFPEFKLTPVWEGAGVPLSVGANAWGDKGFTNALSGRLDEVRISRGVRYTGEFIPPERFQPDESTLALYHFDGLSQSQGVDVTVQDDSDNQHDGRIRYTFDE